MRNDRIPKRLLMKLLPWVVCVGALAFEARDARSASPTDPSVDPRRCHDRSELLQSLKQRYGEVQRARGLSSSGVLIEVMVAPGGSFTIVVTDTSLTTCVVAVGESFEILTEGDPT